MAGTLTISTLSDGTNSTSSTNCIQGSAKAWVSWTGSTAVIRGSYNVSSITRNSAGDFTVTFTTAMPNVNYSVTAATSTNGTYGMAIMVNTATGPVTVAPTTTAVRVLSFATGVGNFDGTYMNVTINGN